ncbi:DEAD/DEAH box helicase [Nonomuraea sp. SBT364]|uniref:DEAD/DEAH box helicase n=1 Tax=Nonomuraea sp. SBT364 TaxID=1580530 RepID=UPI0018CE7511|nr:DEAD/DEAH box helicase [Nonomuraea sp. SBT364]
MALPLALSGQDLIGQARTGTGKTYAFGIAMLQSIGKPRKNRKKPRGLVVVPTRELAHQVSGDLVTAAGKLGSRVLTVYGGRAYEPQIEALKAGVDVIVGTPGRLLDLVKQKHLDLSQITSLVLDEADRMLDLGFLPDIERIFKLIPAQRQTMLFSATMPGEIVSLSRKYLSRPTHVRAEHESGAGETTPQVRQIVWRTHRMDKIEIVARLLQADGRGLTMVFCETKRACDMVAEQLDTRGFAVAAVHGDLGQGQREQALRAFRNGKIDVLVATDVAARGIDIDDVTHVVNYDAPTDDKTYVHRIGRTGRAGRTGIAVTFVEWEELTRWKMINQMLGLDFPEPVETYSTSPHVFTELSIPEGTKGVLPHANRSRAGLSAEQIEDLGETGRPRARGGRRRDEREEREERRPARTPRQRRRTRGGKPSEEGTTVETPEVELVNGRSRKPEETPAIISADEVEAVAAEPRRRTRRTSAERTDRTDRTARTETDRTESTDDSAAESVTQAAPVVEPVKAPEPARAPEPAKAPEPARAAEPTRAAEPVRAARAARVAPAVEPSPAEPVPSFLTTPPPPAAPQEPERIIPPSPFAVIFQSPDLATDDDDIAPSAATERKQQRRQSRGGGGGGGGGGGNRRRAG